LVNITKIFGINELKTIDVIKKTVFTILISLYIIFMIALVLSAGATAIGGIYELTK